MASQHPTIFRTVPSHTLESEMSIMQGWGTLLKRKMQRVWLWNDEGVKNLGEACLPSIWKFTETRITHQRQKPYLFYPDFFTCQQTQPEKAMATHSSVLPGKSHGRRSLVDCSPWGLEELDTTEQLHSHFSLSCIGAGNGNPLQCSCLENPRDRGDWWAAVYGVAQSQTWLKWLSSSSNKHSSVGFQ